MIEGFGPSTPAEMFGELYPELKRLARRERFRKGRPTAVQTTSLIHEAWLKLNGKECWSDRSHFLCSAAVAMRHVLIDAARARLRQKRDPGGVRTTFDERFLEDVMPDTTLVELGSAVERLAGIDVRLASVVDCRFFAGYTDGETADALSLTERTVRRDWIKAKAWLYRELTA